MKLLPYEIWRDVPGYKGRYQVSNNNGFRNLNNPKKLRYYIPKGNGEYRRVALIDGMYEYHKLVVKTFPEICGEWFTGCSVHHKDFNKYNNTPENLIVLTRSEHSKLHYQHTTPDTFKKSTSKRIEGIKKALTGRRNEAKHIPILQYTLNGELVAEWECISDVVREGYSPGNICGCCKGKNRTAYGFIWRYKDR